MMFLFWRGVGHGIGSVAFVKRMVCLTSPAFRFIGERTVQRSLIDMAGS